VFEALSTRIDMKISKVSLTLIYTILSCLGAYHFIFGDSTGTIGMLVLIAGYIMVIASLNGIGGKPFKVIAYIVSGILSLMLIIAIILIVAPFLGYKAIEFYKILVLFGTGLLGVWTFIHIRKLKLLEVLNQTPESV